MSAQSLPLESLRAAGVHTLLVQFTDVHGAAKGKLVPLEHLDEVLRTGAGFAGPSIWGTALPRMGPRSEYYARGDAATLQPLPWMPGVARIVGDGFVDGQAFESCPRQVLKRALARLAERGWALRVGIEPEFFLLKRVGSDWAPADDEDRLDKPSYDLKSLPRQAAFLGELRAGLQACGLDVLQMDHEDAHGQYEVNFAHDLALASADKLMLFKLAAQALADRRSMVFSMMPKPFADQPGSGMHFHVSLWEDPSTRESTRESARASAGRRRSAKASSRSAPRCLFDAEGAGEPLSAVARHFIAGLLSHSAALCAIAAPTVNSYKRLAVTPTLSGTSWAPAVIAHGPNNRTALVRTLPGRFEWRLPDASANPYLSLAAMIAAGLDGVDRRLDPGPAAHDDLFEMSPAALRQRGLGLLPQSLEQALNALEGDEVVRGALGTALSTEFLRLKRNEWAQWSRHVSAWELDRYAAAF